MPTPTLKDTLEKIKGMAAYNGQIKSDFTMLGCAGKFTDFPKFLEKPIIDGLKTLNIGKLYQHQAKALSAVQQSGNVVVSTSTSSGKSLCYWLPVLNDLIKNPRNRAIALYPTKALAQDQLRKLKEIIQNVPELMSAVEPAVYDGDTPASKKRGIRNHNAVYTPCQGFPL